MGDGREANVPLAEGTMWGMVERQMSPWRKELCGGW